MKKDKLFYYTLLFIFFKGFCIQFLGYMDVLNLLADILVIICAIKTPKIPFKQITKISGKPVIYSLALFLILGVLADLLNFVSIKTVLWGVKNIIRLFLLSYAILGRYRTLTAESFKYFFKKMFYINILAVIIDFFAGRKGDWMGGIFAGNGDLAIFLVVSLLFFTSDYMKGKLKRTYIIGIYVLTFYIAMLAEIKFLYFLIPLCLYLTYIFVRKMTVLNVLIFVLSCFFIEPVIKASLSFYYNQEYVDKIFDDDERDAYLTGDGYNLSNTDIGFNRNTCIERAQQIFLTDLQSSLIGNGLGSASNSNTFGTWMASQYRHTGYFFFTSSFVLIETGWIGYILFISIYLFIMLRFLYYYIKSKNNQEKYWAAIGTMMGILTFIFIWYNSAPYVDYYLPFMLWGFCFLGILKNKTIKK